MWCRERSIFASIIKGWSILNTAHAFYNWSNQWFVILSEKEEQADQTLITQKDKSDWCTYCAVWFIINTATNYATSIITSNTMTTMIINTSQTTALNIDTATHLVILWLLHEMLMLLLVILLMQLLLLTSYYCCN
jgi:hypothetical protein